MSTINVAVLVGSLREGSHSRQIARALSQIAPAPLTLAIVEIGDLPFYNPDHEGETAPAAWLKFREQILASDAVLFVTPEYNRSVPAVLKNALDVGSRPYGQSVWAGKPGAVVSQSIGALGGFGANHHLRQSLTFLDIPVLQQPEAYLGNSASFVDADGAFANPDSEAFLRSFLDKFAIWIARNRA